MDQFQGIEDLTIFASIGKIYSILHKLSLKQPSEQKLTTLVPHFTTLVNFSHSISGEKIEAVASCLTAVLTWLQERFETTTGPDESVSLSQLCDLIGRLILLFPIHVVEDKRIFSGCFERHLELISFLESQSRVILPLTYFRKTNDLRIISLGEFAKCSNQQGPGLFFLTMQDIFNHVQYEVSAKGLEELLTFSDDKAVIWLKKSDASNGSIDPDLICPQGLVHCSVNLRSTEHWTKIPESIKQCINSKSSPVILSFPVKIEGLHLIKLGTTVKQEREYCQILIASNLRKDYWWAFDGDETAVCKARRLDEEKEGFSWPMYYCNNSLCKNGCWTNPRIAFSEKLDLNLHTAKIVFQNFEPGTNKDHDALSRLQLFWKGKSKTIDTKGWGKANIAMSQFAACLLKEESWDKVRKWEKMFQEDQWLYIQNQRKDFMARLHDDSTSAVSAAVQ